MARKAKKEKDEKPVKKEMESGTVTVKEFLEEKDFADDETVFMKLLGGEEEEFKVKDIPRKILNRTLLTVQSHYGGIKHGYASHRFIYLKK